MKALFIGGCADGQWREVSEGQEYCEVAALPAGPARLVDTVVSPNAEIRVDSYRRERVRNGAGVNTAVYVYGETDALLALISGYRKPVSL